MMRQWVAAALLLAVPGSSLPAYPAPRSPFVVYEVLPVSWDAPLVVTVRATVRTNGSPGLLSFHTIHRQRDGYQTHRLVGLSYAPSGRYQAYGWPVQPPSCVAQLCGTDSPATVLNESERFEAYQGARLFVVGVRGHLTVPRPARGFVVRESSVGFRVVNAMGSDATGAGTARYNVEHFRSATAPSGRYGSFAMGSLPCASFGVGLATLTTDNNAQRLTMICGGHPVTENFLRPGNPAFSATRTGRHWTLSGNVVGNYYYPERLVVWDYPKP